AWDHYYKASWSGNCRDAAWWSLARLAMKRGDVADALEKVNTSLRFNASNPLAMGLKALALANSGQKKAALEFIFASLEQY
ncbi:tetratricopeptide repeat protein, partial [Escherichia coli]